MPVRVAVVGLGFGRTFARILNDHPDCQLVCVADLNEDMVDETARSIQVSRTARSIDEVLSMNDVDAIAVFTHPPKHATHSINALKSGKHVLCAVPAAITQEECNDLIEAVKTTGLVYANAETSYWRPPTAQCRQWYREGGFGRIVYMEAEYLHDRVHGAPTRSPLDYDGKDWRASGYPPFLYITHSTGHVLGATGSRLIEVTAYPSAVPNDDVYRKDSVWKAPFANAVGLFKTHDGVPVRIMEMRRVAFACEEKFSIYGENLTFVSPHQGGWESSYQEYRRVDGKVRVDPWYRRALYAPLPDELVKYTYGGHDGSHPYIANDWVRSILDARIPEVNVYEAVAFCSPGIVAHESCMKDGERLQIPQFGKLKRDEKGAYTPVIDDGYYQHH